MLSAKIQLCHLFFKLNTNAEICWVKIRKIVLTGGPGTGKTSIISALEKMGHCCFHEVSREITREAQEKGIEQLFIDNPLLFSEMLLKGRIQQHFDAEAASKNMVFLDRGVPDVVAYMNYFRNKYPPNFKNACQEYKYDRVFIFPPWKQIYKADNERYESYDQAVALHNELLDTYISHGYKPVEVPCGSIDTRAHFILKHLG